MTTRQCSPCTACCEGWLSAKILDLTVKPFQPCVHCVDQGCAIYEDRPEKPCVTFSCGWLEEPQKLPERMKPSECGAIVMLDRKWHDRKIITAVPTGKKIPADTLEWLLEFSRNQSTPLMFFEFLVEDGKYIGKKKTGYGPPSFTHAVETEVGPEDIMML